MDFFEQQARARGQTRRMMLLFALAVLTIVAAIDLVAVIAIRSGSGGEGTSPIPALPIFIGTSILVLGVIGLASLYRIVSLSSGGAAVARSLGATFVSPDTASPQHRRLRNIIEEIAIASGVPVPQIFVLEQEPGINAFAAGYSPADAAITVTRGAMEKLTRDQLQGVIAHEFSHLLNGDMRLNIRLMGLLFGILVLTVIARQILYFSPRGDSKRDGGGGIVVVGLAIMVFGYIGVFFGRLIKASVSRSREYLADASAVQFTRQTEGLAGALKKAAGLDVGTQFQTVHGEEVAHMLFGDGVGLSGLYATHPPIVDRIRRLDPQFNPGTLRQEALVWNDPNYIAEDEAPAVMSDFVAASGSAIAPATITAQVANPGEDDYRSAMALHRAMPDDWLAAARDEVRAGDVVMALLVDAASELRAQQLKTIEIEYGAARRAGVEALLARSDALHRVQRLPLAALALPALRRRTRNELIRLMRGVWSLVMADGAVQVFEYCLARLVRDQIADVLAPVFGGQVGAQRLDDCRDAVVTLLSVLAEQGDTHPEISQRAFAAGAERVFPNAGLAYTPPPDWTAALDAALKQLDQLQPAGKQRLIEGLVVLLSADERITLVEAELLRAVCGALHCPLPPLLQN
ncbi:MAG: Peptidase Ste24p [Nevskia sp.]|nr:Peptidase Ste24p [Nevskia sp.]